MAIANWINISQSAGTSGVTTVTITASTYDQLTARTTSFRVKTVNLNLYEDVNILQNPRERVTVSVNPSAITADMTGGTYTFDITSNGEWQITNIPEGWTVSQSAGTGNATITIVVPANIGSSALTETIVVSTIDETATVIVRQSTFAVSPTSIQNIASGGSAFTITVTAPEGVDWIISDYPNWVTFSSTAGTGNGSVIMTVSQNTDSVRNDTVTFITTDSASTASVNISQRGNYDSKYLTFEILSGGTIYWVAQKSGNTKTIHYSVNNGEWNSVTSSVEGTTVTTVSAGDTIKFKGTNSTYDIDCLSYNYFRTTCDFNLYGNMMSMIYGDNFTNKYSFSGDTEYNFSHLFQNCTGLIDINNLILPATGLRLGCYYSMFKGCTSLTTVPELPATTLASYSYWAMFRGCTSLTQAPELPATTLAQYCYQFMFAECSGLTTAPALPATTMAKGCYHSMFQGCTALTTAPVLSATTLAEECYTAMFRNCTSLTTPPVLPATTMAKSCYGAGDGGGMFQGCTALTTAPELPATALAPVCYGCMFRGCTSLTTAPTLPATVLFDRCYQFMFAECTSLTTAPTMSATTMANYCCGGMFNGCTSLTTAPALPATTLALQCYYRMFADCTSLTQAPSILPATTLAEECYYSMFVGCTSLTTAPALPASALTLYCYYGMFESCSSLTTAPELPATTLVNGCYQMMLFGCSNINYIKCLGTNPNSNNTGSWTYAVSSTGTFVKAAGVNWTRGVNGIPSGWTVQDA